MNSTKILVIGGGSIGKRHINNLLNLNFNEIYCLRRENINFSEFGDKVKIITTSEEISKLQPQVVFVCNPTSLHISSINEILLSKKIPHIFMEKPLVHTNEGLNHAYKISEKYDQVFFIGFMLRFHPLVKKIKEIIDSNRLGKVYSARFEFGSFLPYWHPWEDYKISYASNQELGGGVINTICHELDLIQYYFGKPKSVYCSKRNFNILEIEVEEIAESIFEYEDKTVTLHLDYLQKDYDRNIKILAENGKIIWNWHDNQIEIIEHKKEKEIIKTDSDFQVNQLYIDEIESFFKCISDNKISHDLDFNHAILNTEIILKMHQSAEKEEKINI